jgi:hypothetical protein
VDPGAPCANIPVDPGAPCANFLANSPFPLLAARMDFTTIAVEGGPEGSLGNFPAPPTPPGTLRGSVRGHTAVDPGAPCANIPVDPGAPCANFLANSPFSLLAARMDFTTIALECGLEGCLGNFPAPPTPPGTPRGSVRGHTAVDPGAPCANIPVDPGAPCAKRGQLNSPFSLLAARVDFTTIAVECGPEGCLGNLSPPTSPRGRPRESVRSGSPPGSNPKGKKKSSSGLKWECRSAPSKLAQGALWSTVGDLPTTTKRSLA